MESARQAEKRRRMPSPIRTALEEAEQFVQSDIHETAMEEGALLMAEVSQEENSEMDRVRQGMNLSATMLYINYCVYHVLRYRFRAFGWN